MISNAIPEHPKVATVLFDEAHSEAWTISLEAATRMQPAHPADSSLARAAAALAERDFAVIANAAGELTTDRLEGVDVLVISHPSDPKWEATTGNGDPRLSSEELRAIERFVAAGGGLIVLGETEQDKYGNNLNELLAQFGAAIENATVQDYERNHRDSPSWVLAELAVESNGGSDAADEQAGSLHPDLLARVDGACFYRAGTIAVSNGGRVLARTSPSATPPGAALAAVIDHGSGRVAVLADSDLFGDDCIGELSHEPLWLNLVYWAAQPRFRRGNGALVASAAARDPAWIELRDAVDELRLAQRPDGSVDLAQHDGDRLAALVERISTAAGSLAPHFPHQTAYLEAVRSDLHAWVDSGFAKPDFIGSLDAFRPERERRDGIEHLVVFPMYKQNASRDTCFEALIIEVPWPDWLAQLERSRYDNPKFVPVKLVDSTAGYRSECATLFPETFSTLERAPSHFGAIFCDREAERFRRVCGGAAELLGLELPPDAACLLDSPQLSMDAFMLWDLVHDRTHMHGELPFDPFMIRRRSPYWMYSLEELRCDLSAFTEAVNLEREGFAFARHVQYAILLDRMLRFPVTGSRVRNYDGLAGQLVFAFLHREGYLHWADNRLTIEWDRLAAGVGAMRERVTELYHSGIDRSKLAQWVAAHELIAEYVPAAAGSEWAGGAPEPPAGEQRGGPGSTDQVSELDQPDALVARVAEDEFPLSLFYEQLRERLVPVLERPASKPAATAGSACA